MIGKEILNYTIVSFIGKGGMGSVYLAEHKYIKQQKVAIKMINADMVNDFTRAHLQQEAEALARLNHPNIVHFLDYHIDDAGNIYLIEEYAEGVSLEKYLTQINGLIVEDRICAMFEPILDAMNYAHKMHILHRDLKPSNIIITENGIPKILDFGIATLMRDDAQDEGLIMGTPSYMSPEQVKGEKLDERSDIYSLGVVLFQMLTGAAPYDITTLSEFEIKRHVVEKDLPRLKSYYKYISDSVQKVVDKATMKDKTKRYSTCADFKKSLHQSIYPPTISLTTKLAVCIATIIIIGAGLFVWDYNRTKVSYYKDYAEQWGVPVGIGKINMTAVHHREQSYQFKTKAGKVISLALVNSVGKLTTHADIEHKVTRYSWVKYYYSSNGKIDYKEIYSQDSVLLYQMDYSENLRTVIFRRNDQFHTEMDLQAHTTNYTTSSNIFESSRISRYLLTYDEKGWLVEKLFAGFQNMKRCDADRIYGIRYVNDEKGRVLEEQFIGIDGNIKGNNIGLAIRKNTYDNNDDWTSVTYLNAERNQSHDGNNCSVVKLEYDKWGNRIRETYHLLNDEPALRSDMECFGLAYVFENGQRVKQTLLGNKFQPSTNKYGYVSIIIQYDKNGYIESMQYVDENDSPVMYSSSENSIYYSSVKYENDSHGNALKMTFYDKQGELYEMDGYSTLKIEYNDKYKPTRVSYFNPQDEPVLWHAYYHVREMVYDSLQQQIAERYYDEQGNLTDCEKGYAQIQWTFDVHGACTQIAFYDAQSKPVMRDERYAFNEFQYDEQGNMTWSRYFSTQHKSCMTSYGYSAQEYQYDPITNNEIVRINYDSKGDIIEKNIYEYDSRGNQTKSYTVNAEGKLLKGNTVYNAEYDNLNRIIREWHTDLNGKRCNISTENNYAEVRFEYDERGNTTVIAWYDISGKPTINRESVHRRERTFNSMNKIIRELNLGIDMKPVSGKDVNPEGTVSYDNYGRMTEIACFDGYGKPRLTANGYYRYTMEYDNRGLLIREAYYGINDEIVETQNGNYSKKESDYNEKQQVVENRFFNKKSECFRIERTEYNGRGSWTVWHVLNGKQQYDDTKYGYSKLVIEYEDNGIVPLRQIVYQKGTQLYAWRKYNNQKNDWEDWQFGPLTTSSKTKGTAHDKKESNQASNNSNWKKAIETFNNECPSIIKKGSQYSLMVIGATVITDKKIKVTFRTNCSKYEMMDADVKDCISMCKNTIIQYKKQWKLPSNITITFELQDSKNRILN